MGLNDGTSTFTLLATGLSVDSSTERMRAAATGLVPGEAVSSVSRPDQVSSSAGVVVTAFGLLKVEGRSGISSSGSGVRIFLRGLNKEDMGGTGSAAKTGSSRGSTIGAASLSKPRVITALSSFEGAAGSAVMLIGADMGSGVFTSNWSLILVTVGNTSAGSAFSVTFTALSRRIAPAKPPKPRR